MIQYSEHEIFPYNPMLLADFYKIAHRRMYPEGITRVYSTWTPRQSRIEGVVEIISFGQQMAIKKLVDIFHVYFFSKPIEMIVEDYKKTVKEALRDPNPDTKHIESLHKLGYLPLHFRKIPEGMPVPIGYPIMTIVNTLDEFFWLTNYVETYLSCSEWRPSTAATIADRYRRLFDSFNLRTTGSTEFSKYQGHDFSMRGMPGLEAAILTSAGHALSFQGSDTIPVIDAIKYYYWSDRCNWLETPVVSSVPASEHSVQCCYADDLEYVRRLITEVHPTGDVSIVADGRDFWDLMGRILPQLKDTIVNRAGKVIIRPDSGDPVKIVSGDPNAETYLEVQGAVRILWEIFGGATNHLGFRELAPCIGLIYGDAITYEVADKILNNLTEMEFASTCIVLGIGSYTYQLNTRDTFGWKLAATARIIKGEEAPIFKDPKTKSKDTIKKSNRGGVAAIINEGRIEMIDGLPIYHQTDGDLFVDAFINGLFYWEDIHDIRTRLSSYRGTPF